MSHNWNCTEQFSKERAVIFQFNFRRPAEIHHDKTLPPFSFILCFLHGPFLADDLFHFSFLLSITLLLIPCVSFCCTQCHVNTLPVMCASVRQSDFLLLHLVRASRATSSPGPLHRGSSLVLGVSGLQSSS